MADEARLGFVGDELKMMFEFGRLALNRFAWPAVCESRVTPL